ncbi:MAG: FAD-dependent oxidoreductase [Eggerthellaceae bacterium]
MSDFDAIVVGAGCAGSVAAYTLASAGKSVLVVERGNYAGAKNMTGGRIYTHSLAKVFPNYEEAPLQRKVTHERISLMSPDSNFTVDYSARELEEAGKESYTVLRGPFDQWLAEQAENAGAEFIYGIAVEDLIIEDGKVKGINAFGDEITSDVVILADGVNSLLTSKAGLSKKAPAINEVAVGAKETIELPADVIESRFLSNPGEGGSWLFAGDCSNGIVGGAFVYANKESISLGIVATMSEVLKQDVPVYQMLEDFKNRPEIKPLIAGGKTVEYSGHVVPEGGLHMMPEIVGDGVVVAGDAAMLCMNLGYTVRGMDLAVASGEIAAKAVIKALDAGDTSKAGLADYKTMLDNSFIMRDMKMYAKAPEFLETSPMMFRGVPELIRDIMTPLFKTDGEPRKHVMQLAMGPAKKLGLVKLAKFAMKAVKSL